ncbi:hypothetical protein IPZ58_18415 [Streptomyces roseoverticillatus]|uniref:hypothetical protein n=1 Tax=Streptomyces roseoverticillatus TaxID=66429 RepID=UPI001F3EF2A4|nr:hypothetical protein [Streptomyces roseoverticillatus]MCF3103542.1 hypothetical protein [Streptomyces roseoverticillatus]
MKQETPRRSLWAPATFLTATGALVAETAVAAVVLFLRAPAQPLSPSEDDSGGFGIVFLPFFLAFWTLVSAVLAAALVVPTAVLARRTAPRWLPVLALPVAAAAVLAALVMSGHPDALAGHPAACLYWWLGVTAALVPAAVLTLVADRRAATARNPWRLPLWLLGGSCLVPVAGVILVVAGVLAYRAVTN